MCWLFCSVRYLFMFAGIHCIVVLVMKANVFVGGVLFYNYGAVDVGDGRIHNNYIWYCTPIFPTIRHI